MKLEDRAAAVISYQRQVGSVISCRLYSLLPLHVLEFDGRKLVQSLKWWLDRNVGRVICSRTSLVDVSEKGESEEGGFERDLR